MLFLLPGISYAASLTWTGGESSEWNTVHRNWNGSEVFQTGDDVSFGSGKRIFIGVNGTPQAVSPGSIVTAGAVTFWGGDILTGGIIHTSGPTGLTFSNYTTSLSFPGGLRILNGAKVVYDVREAPNGAEFHLGTGPILFENGTLRLRAAADKIATLSNPLVISNSGGIEMDAAGATSGPVRFSGAIDLYGTMTILSLGSNRFAADQLTGPLRIKYRPPGVSVYFNGNLGSRSIELSGPIINDFPPGPLPASTILSLENHGLDGVRITGTNNTYTGGTRIWSSSAPNSAIEVAAQSSLGLGNVEVSGFLRLKGSRNMGTNALLLINEGGQVYLDEGVKLRLRGLRLGSTFYSRGRFTSNNAAPYIRGPGEVRLPHYNLPPTIEPIETGPRTVYAGADVPFTVTANDPDGEVVKVGFAFYENILIREVTSMDVHGFKYST